ncbi:KI18B protein, partial [Eudromia elegans]|nr:KI18B protein [Eudromia elegans]
VDRHVLVFDPDEPSGAVGALPPARAPRQRGKDLTFVFDRVFGEGATQEEVFQHTTRDLLDGVLSGYNCSVFAYGATGAGKTYTMLGSEKSPGIMYLTMVELYKRIEARKDEKSCEVLVSYQEVYNEQIHDLLEPKGPLAIREDPEKGVVVQGLSFHQPKSAEQLLEMLANGNRNRTQHPTDANATSSRSHAVFQIYVKQRDRVLGLTQDLQVAKMSLIDLAGSERASVTKARGERLREGANINRSLLALINVINALADAKSKKTHIPYRDSKLTRLLKDSIGGNCRTVMIAAVSPSALAYEDTYNTLKYANRAKDIKLALKSNVLSLDCHISKYAEICEQLKAEVAELRGRLRAYEDKAQDAEKQPPAPPALGSGPAGLPRLEKAVPKMCSDPQVSWEGDQEADAAQPELEAEQLVQPQELEQGEEVRGGAGSTEQLLRLLEGRQREATSPHLALCPSLSRLVAAVLSIARRQYSLLRAANLLTPDMVTEFEELERKVQQEAGASLEQVRQLKAPAETGGAAAGGTQQDPQGEDAPVGVTAAERRVPAGRAAPRRSQQPPPPASPAPGLAKKRKRSETRGSSGPGTPASLKAKRQRKSCPPERREGSGRAETPGAAGTPCPGAAGSSPLPPSRTPKPCPLTVTRRRLPLATSAAQNGGAPALRDLNMTFDLSGDGASPDAAKPRPFGLPRFPGWENVPCLLNQQDGPFASSGASVPAFTMRGSCIPRPSSGSRASVGKRRRAV